MIETSPLNDRRVPVAELAKIAGMRPTNFYLLARRGLAPKSRRGVPLSEALTWLKSRDARRAARAEAVCRLRELYETREDG